MALFALKHSVFPNPNDVMISQKRVWSGLSKDLDALIDATFGYIPPASSLYYCQWNTIQCLKFYYHLVDSSDIRWTDYTRFVVYNTPKCQLFFPLPSRPKNLSHRRALYLWDCHAVVYSSNSYMTEKYGLFFRLKQEGRHSYAAKCLTQTCLNETHISQVLKNNLSSWQLIPFAHLLLQ